LIIGLRELAVYMLCYEVGYTIRTLDYWEDVRPRWQHRAATVCHYGTACRQ